MKKYKKLFALLTDAVETFINEVDKHDVSAKATSEWTVKDELSHIAYWHNYYAQNYASLAKGGKPFLFVSKGSSTRNQDGVDKLKHKSKKYLIDMLNKAHSSLYQSIVKKRIPKMTYIVGTDYKTEVFLDVVTGHIKRHTIQIKRSKKVV